MRRSDMADHSHPLTPLKSIALQVAPIPNQAFKSDKIFCREKHSSRWRLNRDSDGFMNERHAMGIFELCTPNNMQNINYQSQDICTEGHEVKTRKSGATTFDRHKRKKMRKVGLE